MEEQREIAEREMLLWLSHPSELGRRPARLELAGEYLEEGLRYFVFRFKSSLFSPWQLAVCGGFGEGDRESSGLVTSDYAPYRGDTAERDCREMTARLRAFRERKARALERLPAQGAFTGSVLLSGSGWDTRQFLVNLRSHGMEPTVIHHNPDTGAPSMTVLIGGASAGAALVSAPLPAGRAERAARSSFRDADGALEAARRHMGRVELSVPVCDGVPAKARGALLLMLGLSLCESQDGLGLLTRDMIVTRQCLDASVRQLSAGQFPVQYTVRTEILENGPVCSARTVGLRTFGHWELEIRDSARPPRFLAELLLNAAGYIIDEGAVLLPGETVGYRSAQRLPVSLSPGLTSEEETIKIEI